MSYGVKYEVTLGTGDKINFDHICFSELRNLTPSYIKYSAYYDSRLLIGDAKEAITSMVEEWLPDLGNYALTPTYTLYKDRVDAIIYTDISSEKVSMLLTIFRYVSEFPSIVSSYAWLLRKGFTPDQCMFLSHAYWLTTNVSIFNEEYGERGDSCLHPSSNSGHALFDSDNIYHRITPEVSKYMEGRPSFRSDPGFGGMTNCLQYEKGGKLRNEYKSRIGAIANHLTTRAYDERNIPILKDICGELEEFYSKLEGLYE